MEKDTYNELQNGLNRMLETAWRETDLTEEIKLAMLHAMTAGVSYLKIVATEGGLSFSFCPNTQKES